MEKLCGTAATAVFCIFYRVFKPSLLLISVHIQNNQQRSRSLVKKLWSSTSLLSF